MIELHEASTDELIAELKTRFDTMLFVAGKQVKTDEFVTRIVAQPSAFNDQGVLVMDGWMRMAWLRKQIDDWLNSPSKFRHGGDPRI